MSRWIGGAQSLASRAICTADGDYYIKEVGVGDTLQAKQPNKNNTAAQYRTPRFCITAFP